ncbi:hypothetical protein AB1L07_02225 [Niallia alba]|uniref:hypothetical protein n=1 Tax=Niallia alba TaxID=2729105 RepID=UPI002E1CE2C7|nr:hypothetical protein [Niallia alba]
MGNGNRIIVTSVSSLFEGYTGEILKRDRFYVHVQLDNHPYIEKFTEDEIEIIEKVSM